MIIYATFTFPCGYQKSFNITNITKSHGLRYNNSRPTKVEFSTSQCTNDTVDIDLLKQYVYRFALMALHPVNSEIIIPKEVQELLDE